jgi:hypothetical protein
MAAKDYSLSKKDGWEEYRKRTWLLLPKLLNSDFVSYLVYLTAGLVSYFIFNNGGIEATFKTGSTLLK